MAALIIHAHVGLASTPLMVISIGISIATMFMSTSVTIHIAYYAINQLRLFANFDYYRSSCDNPVDAFIHIHTRKM